MHEKIQEFDVIQVLFKPSSIFQRFDWYNSHRQEEDVEWKIHNDVNIHLLIHETNAKLAPMKTYLAQKFNHSVGLEKKGWDW